MYAAHKRMKVDHIVVYTDEGAYNLASPMVMTLKRSSSACIYA